MPKKTHPFIKYIRKITRWLRRLGLDFVPSVVGVLFFSFVFIFAVANAGSLTPSASPASTFYTLSEIFNPLANTSYDSSGISADQNGSVIEILRYIGANQFWASTSNDIYARDNSWQVGIGTSSPVTKFEVQGTASASYLLTGNTIQVGGYASVGYNRFGTSATSHSNFISTTNDLLINGDFEVDASAQFDSFLQVGTSTLYINPTTGRIGLGTTVPTTMFEVQGTASASYLLTGNTLQVGGFASVAYSRFGTAATSHGSMSAANDLLISGDFEVNGSVAFDGFALFGGNASVSGNLGTSLIPTISASTVCYRDAVAPGPGVTSTLGTCSSSLRYKEDIQPLNFDLANLYALTPVSFKWKSRDQRSIGFIAEDVFPYIPEVTFNNGEGKVEGINYHLFAPYFLAALKDHEQRLNALSLNGEGQIAGVTSPALLDDSSVISSVMHYLRTAIVTVKHLFAEKIETEELTVKKGITIYDEVTNEPYCFKVVQGQFITAIGPCTTVVETPTIITPDITPEPTPELSPEISPEATPEAIPEVIPEITPEAVPEPVVL